MSTTSTTRTAHTPAALSAACRSSLLPTEVCLQARRAPRTAARAAAHRALHDLAAARKAGSERLLLTLDPSDPACWAVLRALRGAAGEDRVITRPAGASVLVDVDLDAS